jgi:hypothetical protein
MTTWMLPGFSCSDLVAVLINYALFICPMIWGSSPAKGIWGTHALLWEWKPPLSQGVRLQCTWCGAAPTVMTEERPWWNSTNLEILNQGWDPTFCSGHRLEVTDITLGSFGLLGSVKSWEVSSEPSLSDHRALYQYTWSGILGAPNGNPFEKAWGTDWKGTLRWTWEMSLDWRLQLSGFSRPYSQHMRIPVLSDLLKQADTLWSGHRS